MIILGIETSTMTSSVCLAGTPGPLASASSSRRARHAEFLTPAIRFCLDAAGLDPSDVSGVAVGLGPGLYTGMRVGLATAQTFAHARGLPCVGIPSLDLLAFAVRWVRADRVVCPVIDARRGELFWGWYRPSVDGVQRVGEFRVGTPDRLAADIEASGKDVLCVGDGALPHAGLLGAAGATVGSVGTAAPDARDLAELAHDRFVREETRRPEDLRPVYLRSPDARINWQHRGALYGGRP